MTRNILILTIMAAITIGTTSCREEQTVNNTPAQWRKIDPTELQMYPIKAFNNDWMALAMGDSRKMNSMTISWGSIGELWNKHVVIVYVSSDRASKKMMDSNRYFTVTAFPDTPENKEALVYIGSHSYSEDPDKTANAGLTVEFTELGNPIISEGNLAIECRKIYSDEFEEDKIPADVKERLYSRMGLHTFYIGEIVNVWTKEMPQAEEQSDSQSEQPL